MTTTPDSLRTRTKVAIIGSGNIGSDLMLKIKRLSENLEVAAMVGHRPRLRRPRPRPPPGRRAAVDTGAAGPRRARRVRRHRHRLRRDLGQAHIANAALLRPHGRRLVDLTPAAIGPYVVPAVNLESLVDAGDVTDVNMVTCGGQATIPIVAAISSVAHGALRRDRRLDRLEVRRSRHPGEHRRVHRDHRRTPSRRSAAPSGARRSSCSTRPSRR